MSKGGKWKGPNTNTVKANKISEILRDYVNKPRFGRNAIQKTKEEDPLLHSIIRWFLPQPRFLYYQPLQAMGQIIDLKSAMKEVLKKLKSLDPELQKVISLEMQLLNTGKSLLSGRRDAPITSVQEISSIMTDLVKTPTKQIEFYETHRRPALQKKRGRRPDYRAHDVAKSIALYHLHHNGTLPGTGTNAQHSPFQRITAEVFKNLGIKADSRRACESALSKLR